MSAFPNVLSCRVANIQQWIFLKWNSRTTILYADVALSIQVTFPRSVCLPVTQLMASHRFQQEAISLALVNSGHLTDVVLLTSCVLPTDNATLVPY